MGYSAYYDGGINFKSYPPQEIVNEGKELFENFDIDGCFISFGGDGKYYEDSVYEYLEKLNPYTLSGEIEFRGEDNSLWRFVFKDDEWVEESGSVIYEDVRIVNEANKEEFIGQIIDIFDDELDPDNPVFMGKKYDNVYEKLQGLMKAWRII